MSPMMATDPSKLQGASSYATIVSVYPFNIREFKPGLVPNTYRIPAARDGKISVVHVEDARFPVYMDHARGSVWVTTPAMLLANSIVFDFICAQHKYRPEDPREGIQAAHPGLFFLPNKVSEVEVQSKNKDLIEEARRVQNNWFTELVKEADDDWARYQRHVLITDVQRYACKALGLERVWNIEIRAEEFQTCGACGNRINKTAIRCQHCQTILNPELWKKSGFIAS